MLNRAVPWCAVRVRGPAAAVRGLGTVSKDPVVFEYEEVVGASTADVMAKLQAAYGYEGLGILGVRNVPGYAKMRAELLPMAYKLAHLPADQLAAMEHAPSYYQFGWSHGKEILEGGSPDFSKGSFYANPLHDVPVTDQALIDKYPSFYMANIWPRDSMPELEGAFKALGQLVVGTGREIARHCDALVANELPEYPKQRMERILRESRMCKGRLLHYFAVSDGDVDADSQSSWCGWHNDHGSLTGLCGAMFQDKDGNVIDNPDPTAGLYIKSRQGDTVHLVMPPDCIAFQIGECSQVHSGGVLQATPHAVRAAATPGVSRSTLAVFMEPEVDYPMTTPPGSDPERVIRGATGELLPPSVPPMARRWNESQDFAEFTDATLSAYHD